MASTSLLGQDLVLSLNFKELCLVFINFYPSNYKLFLNPKSKNNTIEVDLTKSSHTIQHYFKFLGPSLLIMTSTAHTSSTRQTARPKAIIPAGTPVAESSVTVTAHRPNTDIVISLAATVTE